MAARGFGGAGDAARTAMVEGLSRPVVDAARAWTDFATADASRYRTDPSDRRGVAEWGSRALAAASRYGGIQNSLQLSLGDATARSGAADLQTYGRQLRDDLQSNVVADPSRRQELESMVAVLASQTFNRPTVESLVSGIVG